MNTGSYCRSVSVVWISVVLVGKRKDSLTRAKTARLTVAVLGRGLLLYINNPKKSLTKKLRRNNHIV